MKDTSTKSNHKRWSAANWLFAVTVVLMAVPFTILNYVGGGLQGRDGQSERDVKIREYGWPRTFILDAYSRDNANSNAKLVPSTVYRFVNRQFRSSELQLDIGICTWLWALGAMILYAVCFRRFSLKLAFAFMIFTGIIILILQTYWIG